MGRPSAHRRGYDRRWQRIVRAAIELHVRLYGWTCPGWGVPAHYSADLTGDHDLALALGGLSVPGNCRILCRSCNARKGNRPTPRTQLTLDAAAAAIPDPSASPAASRGLPRPARPLAAHLSVSAGAVSPRAAGSQPGGHPNPSERSNR